MKQYLIIGKAMIRACTEHHLNLENVTRSYEYQRLKQKCLDLNCGICNEHVSCVKVFS